LLLRARPSRTLTTSSVLVGLKNQKVPDRSLPRTAWPAPVVPSFGLRNWTLTLNWPESRQRLWTSGTQAVARAAEAGSGGGAGRRGGRAGGRSGAAPPPATCVDEGKALVSAPPQRLPSGLWYSWTAPVAVSVTSIQYSTSERAP